MIKLMFLKEMRSIKQMHQNSVILVTIGFNKISAIDVMIY